MAPPKSGASAPPIPHVAVAGEVAEAAPVARAKAAPSRIVKFAIIGVAALVVLGGAFFAWKKFGAKPPAPPVATKSKPGAPAPAPAKGTVATPPPKAAPLTPSETLNNLAHAPVNAINKAKDTVAAREASGQSRVDGAGPSDDPKSGAASPVAAKPGAPAPAPKTATAVTALGPGLSATTEVDASSEASLPFRSFVANAKIGGVFFGSPSRAFINGKLVRSGETVDATLGIIFEGVENQKQQLIFKDKSGATVVRKF